tara:strand:- start:782 stop:1363 length:582 start_codon:yes stop_codon:yes gene_type:complete
MSKEITREIEKDPKFTFVPSLGFYVADEISFRERDWYDCRLGLKKKGSFMLTAEQFWHYYDFCSSERRDIIDNSLRNPENDEWLNVIAKDKKFFVINPDINEDFTLSGGISGTLLWGWDSFKRKDVNSRTGLPERFYTEGNYWNEEFKYLAPTDPLSALIKEGYEETLVLNFDSIDVTHKHLGVRECRSKYTL